MCASMKGEGQSALTNNGPWFLGADRDQGTVGPWDRRDMSAIFEHQGDGRGTGGTGPGL